jgi:hypothetical protein
MQRRKALWGIGVFVVVALLCSGALWAWLRPPAIFVPPRQYPPNNAYDAYKKLAERMRNDLDKDRRFRDIESRLHSESKRGSVSAADKEYYMKRISPYLEAYRRHLDQPCVAVYEYDFSWLFPELANFRDLARGESFMIRRALERNQPKEATDRATTMMRFAEQIRNEGAWIHYLVGRAIITITLSPLRESLSSVDDPNALQAIVEMARRYEQERAPLSQAVEEEYYLGLSTYRDLRTGKLKWGAIQNLTGQSSPVSLEEWLYATGLGTPFLLASSLKEYEQWYASLRAELEKPLWERKLRAWQPRRYLNQLLVFPVESFANQELAELATVRLLGCAAAIKLHRLRTGRYPDSLDALKLGQMMIDPFTGKPFVYRRDAMKGFQLYSVGANRVDDGGRVASDESAGDITPVELPASQRPSVRGALSMPVWIR